MTDVWQRYVNAKAGYAVEYPPGWATEVHTLGDGSVSTNFVPPNGGRGILVMVRLGTTVMTPPDFGNVRCQDVQVDGLHGRLCVDTIAGAQDMTISAAGKTYTISSSLKGEGGAIFDQFVSGFRLVST